MHPPQKPGPAPLDIIGTLPVTSKTSKAGMALEAVQAQAGHASIESTRVYLHLANDWLATEYRRAAALTGADTGAGAEMLAVEEAAGRGARRPPASQGARR